MKKILFMFFCFLSYFSVNIYSQGFLPNLLYLNYPAKSFEFKENRITFWAAGTLNGEPEKNLVGTYQIENIGGVNFINVKWNNGQVETYLVLFNRNLCYLYKNDGYMYFRGFRITNAAPGEFCFSVDYDNVQISSSSYLTEGNIKFKTENLNDKIGICWAEGVTGNGINEKLYIKAENTNSLHISTGFVSYTKPYLFNENSRPKKVELSVVNKYSIIINLDDTPNFQTIILPEELKKDEILTIKILEVYSGTKYEDTCINMILLDWAKY